MLNKFVNSGELERGIFDPFYGEFVDSQLRDKFVVDIAEPPILENPDDGIKDERVEFAVYDSERNLQHWTRLRDFGFNSISNEEFELDFYQHVKDADLPDNPQYVAQYNFFRRELGSYPNSPMWIQETSNTEVRIRIRRDVTSAFRNDFRSLFESSPEPFKFVANFANNEFSPIFDWDVVYKTDEDGNVQTMNGDPIILGAVVRLQKEVDVKKGQEVWIDELLGKSYFDRFSLETDTQPEPVRDLGPPDFTASSVTGDQSSTSESIEDILDGQTSKEFADSAFGMQDRVDLNVDYSEFDNFVQYSSAEERLKNFRFKLRLLEQYQGEINKLAQEGDVTGRTETVKRKADELVATFDDYEQWLFENDDEAAYPKRNDGSLYKPDSPTTKVWFEDKLEEARRFDDENDASLRKQIPDYILEDERNEEFVLFIDLIGHWFDVNWLYIEHLEFLSDQSQDIFSTQSLSSDLSREVVESFGLDTFNGFDADEILDEFFDKDNVEKLFENMPGGVTDPVSVVDESGEVVNDKINLTRFQAQQQVWRRLLNTVIHKYKTKGTEKGIEALLSVFGIPSRFLTIREFGGIPGDPDADPNVTTEVEDETYVLPFFSNQYIRSGWNTGRQIGSFTDYEDLFGAFDEYPKAIEIRFRTEFQNNVPIKLFEIEGALEVRLEKGNADFPNGEVVMEVRRGDGTREVARTSSAPIFDNRWCNILVQLREDEPYVDLFFQRQSPFGNVSNERETSIQLDISTAIGFLTAPDVYVGGNLDADTFNEGSGFIGDVDKFMIWQEDLSIENFNEHTLAPTKIDFDNDFLLDEKDIFGRSLDTLRRELLVLVDFPEPQNLFTDREIPNEAPNEEFFQLDTPSQIEVQNPSLWPNYAFQDDSTIQVAGGDGIEASGYPNEGSSPFQFELVNRVNFFKPVRMGNQSFFSSKIRIEDVDVVGRFDPEETALEGEFDSLTRDSRKVGIFFSFVEGINRDILSEIGIEDINDFLGDPRDQNLDRYTFVETLNSMYTDKYEEGVDRQLFMELVDEFYDAFFDHVRKCVPARARLLEGIVIEPHALDRSRVPKPDGQIGGKTLVAQTSVNEDVDAQFCIPRPVGSCFPKGCCPDC